jgi:hypothetical protein
MRKAETRRRYPRQKAFVAKYLLLPRPKFDSILAVSHKAVLAEKLFPATNGGLIF